MPQVRAIYRAAGIRGDAFVSQIIIQNKKRQFGKWADSDLCRNFRVVDQDRAIFGSINIHPYFVRLLKSVTHLRDLFFPVGESGGAAKTLIRIHLLPGFLKFLTQIFRRTWLDESNEKKEKKKEGETVPENLSSSDAHADRTLFVQDFPTTSVPREYPRRV